MAVTIACIHEGQYYNNSSWGTFNTKQACYVGTNANGANVTVIKFTTPSFGGISSEVTISFPTASIGGVYSELYYALCTSDANAKSYLGTTSATPAPESVEDEYRIATGTIARFYPGDDVTFTIDTSELQPNTSYYVVLWGQNTWSRAQINSNITETLSYEEVFKIVFDGGSYDDLTVADYSVDIGASDIPVLPDGLGKTFVGWYNSAGVKAEVGNSWQSVYVDGESFIYLYSKWDYALVEVEGQLLADIADAIRDVLGQTKATTYKLAEMPAAIRSVIPNS